jgi:riboflavin kinase/FMN adenylyltransferase
MKIYRDLNAIPEFKNTVITIGSFDGVHPGHRHIIEQMKSYAHHINGETLLVTFYPHPRIALAEQKGVDPGMKLLCQLDEKAAHLEQCGMNNLVVVPFTKNFSEQSPDEYIEDFLVRYFHPKVIVIGYDHRFGKGRIGDIEYLKKFQDKYGFIVIEISKQEVDGIAVSSSKIRTALEMGDVALADKLLGYPYAIQGTVVGGKQIGRTLGFPTANIYVHDKHKLIPPVGIYAVLINIDEQQYKGMLYIGSRPTLDEGLECAIEVHIFEFHDSIYDRTVKIDFIDFLRADEKFDSLDELKAQLQKDMVAALNRLKDITLA